MRSYGFGAFLVVVLIQLGVWSTGSSQNAPPFGQRPEFSAEQLAEAEQPPRFEVEIIAFAYNAFDPAEEEFDRKPRPAPLETLPVRDETLEEPSPRGFGVFRSPEEEAPPSGERPFPRFPGTDTGAELPPTTPGNELGEEELSISEQILSRLIPLEEGPDALEPLDPEATASLDQAPPGDPTGLPAPAGPGAAPGVDEGIEPLGTVEPESTPQEPAVEPFRFRFLSTDELQLTDARARLERLDAYTVLVHGGWVQEGLAEDLAEPIDLSALGVLNPRGTVRLHLSRFLHLTLALDYQGRGQRPVPPAFQGFGPYREVLEEVRLPPVYELRATRRARSGEIHYFDHPAFGLLVVVRPAPEAPEGEGERLDPPIGPAA